MKKPRHFGEVRMKPQRKLWELQHQTICKVIGMAFDLEDLKKIARKFGISHNDPLMDHEFALHSTAVQLCGSDNKVARHIQKMIQARFARYSHRLSALEACELIESVTDSDGNREIPLWAILWDLSTRGLENGASVETALFGFIHMLEHRLMREFWESAPKKANERAEEDKAAEEATRLKRQILDLQGEVERHEKLNERLRMQLEEVKAAQASQTGSGRSQAPVEPVRVDQTEKLVRLQMFLEDTQAQKQSLEEECSRLRKEIEVLAREVSQTVRDEATESQEPGACHCPYRDFLSQKHVTMVGGISSLECHYRNVVEAMGGTFQRHDGDCRGGEWLIQDCVRRADLVVCPVEVNSHNAVKSVKKLCKKYGVACCFPRTAGLSGFRMAIEEHFSESQVA